MGDNFLRNLMINPPKTLAIPIDKTLMPLMIMLDPPSPQTLELVHLVVLLCCE